MMPRCRHERRRYAAMNNLRLQQRTPRVIIFAVTHAQIDAVER